MSVRALQTLRERLRDAQEQAEDAARKEKNAKDRLYRWRSKARALERQLNVAIRELEVIKGER